MAKFGAFSGDRREDPGHRRTTFLLLSVALLTYAYFANMLWNTNTTTRMALSLSIVERGRLDIDHLEKHTIDKAYHDGHYYADKAPGMSLMALPVVGLGVAVLGAGGPGGEWFEQDRPSVPPTLGFEVLLYLAEVACSVVPTALAVAALHRTALRLGVAPGGALFAALAFGFGTPAWGWATTFFGHATSGALQFLALAAVLATPPDRPRRELSLHLLAGFLLGWSTVVEFTAGPSAALIGLYALARSGRRVPRVAAAMAAGGAVAVAPLLAYNALAFGSPLALGYGYVSPQFAGMRTGFFGVGTPSPSTMYEIILGQHRGIVWIAPVLLVVPFALWRLSAASGRHGLAALLAAVVLYYLLLNASYYYWSGGSSTGPRHLTPLLPFACLPLGTLWAPRARWPLAVLLGVSIALSLVCASVGMDADEGLPRLVWDYLVPRFGAGDLGGVPLHRSGLLPGHLALLPLGVMWAGSVFLALRWVREPGRARGMTAAS